MLPPFDQLYVCVPVPPMADAVAPPSATPLHDAFESTMAEATRVTGSVILIVALSLHPFISVIVTV